MKSKMDFANIKPHLREARRYVVPSLFIILPLVVYYLFFGGRQKGDPNWKTYNIEKYSIKEAVEAFGDDLLFDKMILPSVERHSFHSILHLKYDLPQDEVSVNDTETWDYLESEIKIFGKNGDRVCSASLHTYFDENSHFLVNENYQKGGMFYEEGHEYVFDQAGGGTEIIVNGINVTYVETANEDYEMRGEQSGLSAKFTHNGHICYFQASSVTDEYLVWDILMQLLDEEN